jgi:hypothetical protein
MGKAPVAATAQQRLHRPRQPGVLVAAMAAIAALAAACGGSAASTALGGVNYQKAVSYAQCMRSHGEPSWPDPTIQGNFQLPPSLAPFSPQFQSANKACAKLLPNGGQVSPAVVQKAVEDDLRFAACMRTHGVPDFPDPTQHGNTVSIAVSPGSSVDTNSPQFQSAQQACESFLPGAHGAP